MRGLLSVVGVMLLSGCSGSSIDVGPGTAGAGGTSGASSSTSGAPNGGSPSAGTSNSCGGASSAGSNPGETAGSGNPSCDLEPATCTNTHPIPSFPSTTSCATTTDLPIVGTWRGYIEGQGAPWDALTLKIEGANAAGLCGSLKVGDVAPPPPATDGTIGYPPSAPDNIGGGSTFVPGFVMTLVDGKVDDARVRFGVAQSEAYKGWCELQTPYGPGDSCNCMPTWPMQSLGDGNCVVGNPGSATVLTTNCARWNLCSLIGRACACNASGCTANPEASTSFDLSFSGDTAEGSKFGETGRVHFTRVP